MLWSHPLTIFPCFSAGFCSFISPRSLPLRLGECQGICSCGAFPEVSRAIFCPHISRGGPVSSSSCLFPVLVLSTHPRNHLSNCIHWTITCAPLRLGDLLGIVGRQLLGNGREERGVYTLSTSLRSHKEFDTRSNYLCIPVSRAFLPSQVGLLTRLADTPLFVASLPVCPGPLAMASLAASLL